MNQERVLLSREVTTRQSVSPPPNYVAIGILLSGQLDFPALECTLNAIVLRHPVLRSAIFPNPAIRQDERDTILRLFANSGLFEPGAYLYSVIEDVRLSIWTVDLSGFSAAKRDEEIHLIVRQERAREFGYGNPPFMRACLLKVGEDEHLLLLFVNHVVSDAWSLRVIREEIPWLYAAVLEGRELPCVPLSFVDFTAWQNKMLETPHFNDDVCYWRQLWAEFGADRIGFQHLPFVLVPPTVPNSSFGSVRGNFVYEETRDIRSFLRRWRLTLYMLFVAAYSIVLRHYTGKERIAFWAHFSNRLRPEMETAVGLFVNTHLLGLSCPADLECTNFLSQVRSVVLNSSMHQEMPIPHLWRILRCHPRYWDANILLDVYSMRDSDQVTVGGRVSFRTVSLPETSSPWLSSLGVYVEDYDEELLVISRYAIAAFPERAVKHLIEDIKTVVLAIISDPQQTISSFAYVGEKYSEKWDPQSREMNEFVVVGSDRIPGLPY